MIVSLRRWLKRAKFFLLLFAITYAIYHVFDVVTAWIEPNKYREPDGRAVKAFRAEPPDGAEDESALDRLRLFYWYGE